MRGRLDYCYRCLWCLSICLLRGSSQLHLAKMAEQIKMLFGVNTLGGTWNIVLDMGRRPPFKFRDPLRISGMAETRDLKFCMCIEGRGPN